MVTLDSLMHLFCICWCIWLAVPSCLQGSNE